MRSILAIETATNACSVALQHGEHVIERYQVGSNIHSQILLSMVSEVLAEVKIAVSELDAVAVGQGPGSFTGLRIGIGVAQGIAYGSGCKMLGISSLAALAWQAIQSNLKIEKHTTILAGIDARMNEIYCAKFFNIDGMPSLHGKIKVLAPEKISSDIAIGPSLELVGNAWGIYASRLGPELTQKSRDISAVIFPNATGILALAQVKFAEENLIDPREFHPEYIRDDVAKKSVNPI